MSLILNFRFNFDNRRYNQVLFFAFQRNVEVYF